MTLLFQKSELIAKGSILLSKSTYNTKEVGMTNGNDISLLRGKYKILQKYLLVIMPIIKDYSLNLKEFDHFGNIL